MKIEWEVSDIIPGRRVGKPDRREQWMIGYLADRAGTDAVRYVLISLIDGMVQSPLSAEAMADHLNGAGE